jgi:chromosome segregation ATPase
MVDSERRCAAHKDRVAKLESEAISAHDSRIAERKTHAKTLNDIQLQYETLGASSRVLDEKVRILEQANQSLKGSMLAEATRASESKSQLEELERLHAETVRTLKQEKTASRQLQDALEILKLDKERDLLQFEEKLRRLKATTGESTQTLVATETKLTEVTTQLFQHKSRKEELQHSLEHAEEQCEKIQSQVKRLQEQVTPSSFPTV